jgi:hypothetical protein
MRFAICDCTAAAAAAAAAAGTITSEPELVGFTASWFLKISFSVLTKREESTTCQVGKLALRDRSTVRD